MKRTRIVQFIVLSLLSTILGYFCIRWFILTPQSLPTSNTIEDLTHLSPQVDLNPKQHEISSRNSNRSDVPWEELKQDDPWIVFYSDAVELMIEAFRRDGVIITSKKRESIEAQLAAVYSTMRTEGKEIPDLPKLSDLPPAKIECSNSRRKLHQGAQTVEAIMESFDAMDRENPSSPGDEEVEERYPREEWIQRLLGRGIVFEDYSDYSGYLGIRRTLVHHKDNSNSDYVMSLKENYYGVPPNASFEEFTNAIIDKSHQELTALKQAELEDPLVTGGAGTPSGLISMRMNTLYVKVDTKNFSSAFYGGGNVSETEIEALLFDGIAPQGLEVVYLDVDDKPLPAGVQPRLDWANFDWDSAVQNMSDGDWAIIEDIIGGRSEATSNFIPTESEIDPDAVIADQGFSPQVPAPNQDTPQSSRSSANGVEGTTALRLIELFEKLEKEDSELPENLGSLRFGYEAWKRKRKETISLTKSIESEITDLEDDTSLPDR